ncbi:PREDICTED: otopetrin-2-like [Priapulus caudatus]|uniref:Otopetrin-2-like n=1 Tax=Priapulus caudatus TaxID=37621 RepID=A0ABM1F7H4_PRICU|nr:PREDICTED: otopetrin-2-like [Priapulus caudatus]
MGTILGIFVFFMLAQSDDEHRQEGARIVSNAHELLLRICTLVGCVCAFRYTSRLVDAHGCDNTFLDDFLLFASLPMFYVYCGFGVMAAAFTPMSSVVVGTLVLYAVSFFEMPLQTTFIMDGLRRGADARLARRKPGRGIIMFVLIANLCVWLVLTFEVKTQLQVVETAFYGYTTWTIISKLCVPLTIFYRFHSAVCLWDIWDHAYKEHPL